jgi:hypothetical protein
MGSTVGQKEHDHLCALHAGLTDEQLKEYDQLRTQLIDKEAGLLSTIGKISTRRTTMEAIYMPNVKATGSLREKSVLIMDWRISCVPWLLRRMKLLTVRLLRRMKLLAGRLLRRMKLLTLRLLRRIYCRRDCGISSPVLAGQQMSPRQKRRRGG